MEYSSVYVYTPYLVQLTTFGRRGGIWIPRIYSTIDFTSVWRITAQVTDK